MAKLDKGMPAPDFEAQDQTGRMWSLTQLKGSRVVLYFYPADDTPGCTLEACDFRDNHDDLQKAGYVVLGVSSQGAESHGRFAQSYNLNFPLLIDEDLSIADAYGVRRERKFFQDVPIDVTRSTFVVDEDGKIVEALYGVNPQGHVEELREKLGV